MRFHSEKDPWLTLTIFGSLTVSILSCGYSLLFGRLPGMLTPLIILGAAFVFVLWIWLTTYYDLDDDNLIIRSGPFKKTVPLNEIHSVKKTSNIISSPALSLKRLHIKNGNNKSAIISPQDRDEFLEILRKRCPNAKI
ncbi:PH domain-containing protein [Bacillus sp. T33-2]|uniref:PH domain-containing protein n=1 Tax=Bacillus sp. T33-2 TaxID=2054168 RepID=UPI0015E078BD|nr:PH domain-containing protein [Bacillus sp. T33-2]